MRFHDELIRAVAPARNRLMGLENLSDAELDALQEEFNGLAKEERASRSETRRGAGAKT